MQRSITPKDYVYSQYNVTGYEDPYTSHIESVAEMVHDTSVIHQSVIKSRKYIANGRRQHEA